MNRARFRAFSLVTLLGLGITTGGTIATGGCAFSGAGDPVASVCQQIGIYLQTCNVANTCQSAFVKDCTKTSATVSEATLDTLFACADTNMPCAGAGSAMTSACFATGFSYEFNSIASTPAQVQLAHDYCHACAPNQENCGQLLFLPGTDASVPPGGGSIFAAGDSILEAIDSQCIPGLPADAGAECADTFTKCAAPLVTAGIYLPPDCIVSGYTATGQSTGGVAPADAGPTDSGSPEAGRDDAAATDAG